MKIRRILLLILIWFVSLTPVAFAWDLEIGIRSLIPRIGTGVQEYTDKNGDKKSIKPTAESTATGFSYHMGLRLESFLIDFDTSEFKYDSSISANSDVVLVDTEIQSTVSERRLGVNYHLERELAGMFFGIGLSEVEEVLKSDNDTWTFKTTTPYFKAGLDLILGSWIIRYEQIFESVGDHSVQINSAGILLKF